MLQGVLMDDVLARLQTLTRCARSHRKVSSKKNVPNGIFPSREKLTVTAAPGPQTDRLLACLREDGFEVEWIRKEAPGEPVQMELF